MMRSESGCRNDTLGSTATASMPPSNLFTLSPLHPFTFSLFTSSPFIPALSPKMGTRQARIRFVTLTALGLGLVRLLVWRQVGEICKNKKGTFDEGRHLGISGGRFRRGGDV